MAAVIPQLLLFSNGKGGAGKTSASSEVAAGAARAGWRVLAIDLDPQGNLARNLGYMDRSDGGAEFAAALRAGRPPVPIEGVRPNLDVIAGGPEIHDYTYALQSKVSMGDPNAAYRSFEDSLAPLIEGRYDLAIVDMPPTRSLVHTAAYTAAHYLVIPTPPDACSVDGLAEVVSSYSTVRETTNPALEILGVVVFRVGAGSKRIRRQVSEELHELLGDDVPVFEPMVRDAQAAAIDLRQLGVTAAEYETEAAQAPPWYQAIRAGKKVDRSYSQAASGLAQDYQEITEVIIRRFVERQSAFASQVAP